MGIVDQSCACTSSGFSGISLSDDGTLVTYGNTTFVGCAPHTELLVHEGVDVNEQTTQACYVLGGADCPEATPSTRRNDRAAFTMAAWRECSSLSEKAWVFADLKAEGGGPICNPAIGCTVCKSCCKAYISAGDACAKCAQERCHECHPSKGCNVCSECCYDYIQDGEPCEECVKEECAWTSANTSLVA